MINYPMQFLAKSTTAPGIQSNWEIHSPEAAAACCVPPEFEGPGGAFSPEDLYAQALCNCLVATFKVYAQHSQLTFERMNVVARLVVDRDEQKKPVMKHIAFDVQIKNPSSTERCQLLLKKAFDSGFILNSVKTTREYSLTIT